MIDKLRKKISVLLLVVEGLIVVMVFLAFNWGNYQRNMDELSNDVRTAIHDSDVGWNGFLESYGAEVDLGDIEYCIFQVDSEKTATMYFNGFSNQSDKKLLKYGQRLANHWRDTDELWQYCYIYVRTRKLGRFIVLMSGRQALHSSFPMLFFSGVCSISLLILLSWMMKKLSNWLVMPVQEMMESEKTFMSNASHELKTPLSVISASTELLMDEVGEKKYLKNIQQETEHMIKLVNRMLTLLRLDAPYNIQEYQKFSVDELIFNVCYPLESVAYEKGIRMELDVASDISMTGDLEQIRSVVSILVDNAISYTNSGGKIRIQARRDNEKIMILVANTGEPIPEQLREQLFERYFRNDFSVEASEGHFGLGLSIAGRVVENHHGSIRVYSTDGENIFEVLLPVCEVRSNVLFGFLL